ncbi:beta/gamma crystallin domain-containing protein [Kutzneria buriramensis]|uniref:beta/gamma crystallin domain-containing protein n=1 Tax=Kutzneria buriramensis TaxID=1045776 RepID=UPI001B87145D|nr:beta/gamma crystallin domain-containing protein [Kutzneria buriramensis]
MLTTAALVASLTVGATAASAAPAINTVPCDRPDYLQLTLHRSGGSEILECFANGGEWDYPGNQPLWVTRISTGNNRVQWHGDGAWQPATPIGKNTVFTWPHFPGGVRIDAIRIV